MNAMGWIIGGTIFTILGILLILVIIRYIVNFFKEEDGSTIQKERKIPKEFRRINLKNLSKYTIFIIEGVIAVGKSSLSKGLVKAYGGIYIPEGYDNSLLSKFLKHPKDYAEPFQDERVKTRKEVMIEAEKLAKEGKGPIFIERSILFDPVFERLNYSIENITENYHRTYTKKYEKYFERFLTRFSYLLEKKRIKIIYLESDINRCMKSLKKRCVEEEGGNPDEIKVTPDYQEKLHQHYKIRIEELQQYGFEIQIINWTTFGVLKKINSL